MLQPTEVKQLSQLSATRTALSLFMDWALIALAFAACAYFANFWVYAAAFVVIGRTQLGLAILMHDGAHRRLFKSHTWNDWVGQFTCGGPLFFAMDSYKRLHLKHHLNPLAADDPDLSLIGGYPISRASFIRKITRDLTGVSYFKFIGYFLYKSRQEKPIPKSKTTSTQVAGPSKLWIASSIITAQAVIFGALWFSGHPWFYLTLWIVPFMTALQFLLRIRGIAEHAGYHQNDNQALNARTVVNPVQTFFFAPHGVHYHIEHHLYPSIPFYHLPKAHKLLKERGVLPPANFYRSYGKIMRELIRLEAS